MAIEITPDYQPRTRIVMATVATVAIGLLTGAEQALRLVFVT